MTIRAKLTLLNAGVIAIITSCLGIIIYFTTSSDLQSAVDRELMARGKVAQRLFAISDGKSNSLPSQLNSVRPFDPAELSLRQPRVFDDTDLNDPRLKYWDRQALMQVRETGRPIVTTLRLPADESLPEEMIRVLTMRMETPGHPKSCIQIAASLASVHEESERLATRLLVLIPLSWIGALAAGWLLTNLALKPIGRLAQDSQALLEGNPRHRLPDRDPDEMGQLARVINQGLDKIEAGYRRLERFAGDASHELKSPLTAILLRASSAPEDNPQAMAANLEAIRKSARGMSSMVSDLLLAAKIQDRVSTSDSAFDVKEAVVKAVLALDPNLAQRVELIQSEPVMVHGDSALLERVFSNLILNSLQHGGPEVEVKVRAGQEGGRAKIQVEDNGVGIAPEDLPYVFERFYRGDSARTHGDDWTGQGSGLGLAISLGIIERMGGSLECQSAAGSGATMTVWLPLAS